MSDLFGSSTDLLTYDADKGVADNIPLLHTDYDSNHNTAPMPLEEAPLVHNDSSLRIEPTEYDCRVESFESPLSEAPVEPLMEVHGDENLDQPPTVPANEDDDAQDHTTLTTTRRRDCIAVGPLHQVDFDALENWSADSDSPTDVGGTLQWDPTQLAADVVDQYVAQCKSIVPPENASCDASMEELLVQLHQHKYDVPQTIRDLISASTCYNPAFVAQRASWDDDEITAFERAMNEWYKRFWLIQEAVPSKSVSELIEFYFIWKKTARYEQWLSTNPNDKALKSRTVGAFDWHTLLEECEEEEDDDDDFQVIDPVLVRKRRRLEVRKQLKLDEEVKRLDLLRKAEEELALAQQTVTMTDPDGVEVEVELRGVKRLASEVFGSEPPAKKRKLDDEESGSSSSSTTNDGVEPSFEPVEGARL